MTRPRAEFPDVERDVIDVVTDLLADEDCDVGRDLPDDWTTASTPFVQVGWDATINRHQIVALATVRVTVWAGAPDDAKRLARLTEGLLMERPEARPLTGIFPARDAENHAEVASFTVRWSARSVPIP